MKRPARKPAGDPPLVPPFVPYAPLDPHGTPPPEPASPPDDLTTGKDRDRAGMLLHALMAVSDYGERMRLIVSMFNEVRKSQRDHTLFDVGTAVREMSTRKRSRRLTREGR